MNWNRSGAAIFRVVLGAVTLTELKGGVESEIGAEQEAGAGRQRQRGAGKRRGKIAGIRQRGKCGCGTSRHSSVRGGAGRGRNGRDDSSGGIWCGGIGGAVRRGVLGGRERGGKQVPASGEQKLRGGKLRQRHALWHVGSVDSGDEGKSALFSCKNEKRPGGVEPMEAAALKGRLPVTFVKESIWNQAG